MEVYGNPFCTTHRGGSVRYIWGVCGVEGSQALQVSLENYNRTNEGKAIVIYYKECARLV